MSETHGADPVPVVAITSPPYAESVHGRGTDATSKGIGRADGRVRGREHTATGDYGDTPGNLGNLRDTEPDAPTARQEPILTRSDPAQAILPLDGIPARCGASTGRNPYQPACPDWHGLYQGSTSRDDALFRPESTAHPAKMSIALTRKILETMQGWGWLQPGGCVLDPFGGRGTTAAIWCAMHPENRACTVELEAHFVQMQRDNQSHAERKLRRPLHWEILRGDSRFCHQLLAGDLSTTRALVAKERAALEAVWRDDWRAVAFQGFDGYAAAVGKPWVLEAWPDRAPVGGCAVTSPPYADATIKDVRHLHFDPKRRAASIASSRADPPSGVYGDTPGNLGNLPDREACVTSPPWEAQAGAYEPTATGPLADPKLFQRHAASNRADGYSAVTSPPYADQAISQIATENRGRAYRRDPKQGGAANNVKVGYGETPGQIGAVESEDYAGACLRVYAGLAEAGVRYVAVVTKNPTRNGKLRRLDKLTARLLRQAGYQIRAWRRAWLFQPQAQVDERMGQSSLFGDEVEPSKKMVGRMSFFRRLHMAKGGVAAAWEDCLFAELAAGAGGCAVTSPPYADQKLAGFANGLSSTAERRGYQDRHTEALRAGGFEYGTTPGNLGNLRDPEAVCVTSPPYAESTANTDRPAKRAPGYAERYARIGIAQEPPHTYGTAEGNLGNLRDPEDLEER